MASISPIKDPWLNVQCGLSFYFVSWCSICSSTWRLSSVVRTSFHPIRLLVAFLQGECHTPLSDYHKTMTVYNEGNFLHALYTSKCNFTARQSQKTLSVNLALHDRNGHGAMLRAWTFANVAGCRAASNPAWCRENTCLSNLNIGKLFRCCVLGEGSLSSRATFYSGVNKYLLGQRWQCVGLRNGFRSVCSPWS